MSKARALDTSIQRAHESESCAEMSDQLDRQPIAQRVDVYEPVFA